MGPAKININTYDFNDLLKPIYKSLTLFVCDQTPIFSVLFIYSSPVVKNLTIHSFDGIHLIDQVRSIFVFVANTIFERILYFSRMVIKILVTNLPENNPEKLLNDFSDIQDCDNNHANIFRTNSTRVNNQMLVLIPMFLFVNFAHKYSIKKKSENSNFTENFLDAKIYLSIFIIYLFFILCFIGCQNYPLSITISLFITPRVYKLTHNLLNGVKYERNLLYFMDFVLKMIILALVYYFIFISNKHKSIELLNDLLISSTAIFSTVNDSIKNHLYLSLPCYSLLSLSYSFSICTFRIKYWKFSNP